ncbi:MAG: hypothetical protein ACRC9L_03165 [Brevinema sp.]
MARGQSLKDEPIEYRKEQYDEKNMVLSQFGESVSAITMYEDIFDDTSLLMPVVVIDENEEKHMVKMTIDEAIEQARGRNDILLGGATYFKEFVSKGTAKDIYAFIIDMDNVYSGILLRALQHDWKLESGEYRPMPTYIVNSGLGLHLYFVLDKPIPYFKRNAFNIDKLYRTLAEQQTTRRNYLREQRQWFGQDFRMAGGCGKDMWENVAFKIGDKWNADDLAKACGLTDVHFFQEGEFKPKEESKKLSKKKKVNRKGFFTNRAFYDYALKQCQEKSNEGWRYTSMCALTVIAYKCRVSQDELEKDLSELLPLFNKNATRKVKEREIVSAMKMYNEKAIETPRERLQDWQGWKYEPKIKRNGRKRAVHLERARAVQKIDSPNGEWRNKDGRPSAEQIVRAYQSEHPEARKVDCIRDTKLSKPTVYKYWK